MTVDVSQLRFPRSDGGERLLGLFSRVNASSVLVSCHCFGEVAIICPPCVIEAM